MSSEGLLILPGAQAALEPTPRMIGYGKAAVHHLTTSLSSLQVGLPTHALVMAILP
jgi:dihydropteridine reductase